MSTKDLILSHAEGLARRRGYDGFSFADLAEGARIRKASVHHHFPTKATLSTDLMEKYSQRVFKALDDVADKASGAKLDALISLYRKALEGGESQCLCVAFSAIVERLPEPTKRAVLDYQTAMQAWIAQLFREAQEDGQIEWVGKPDQEAASVFALLEGAQLVARTAQDIAQFDLALAALRARIRTGETE